MAEHGSSLADHGSSPAPSRPRLNLKPRDPAAAARLEAERQKQLGSKNPFGAAKPREAVIAEKLGKTEEEVLKEEVSKEKLHLRLSGAQLEEKRVAEASLKEVEEQLELESDAGKKAELTAELAVRQKKLDDLMEAFAKVTLETALSGGAPRVSQIRHQQQLQQEQGGPAAGTGSYGQRYNPTQQYAGGGGAGGGGSFGGREFNDNFGGGGGSGGGGRTNYQQGGSGRGGRGFSNYQQRGGFSDSYQQGGERQGGGSYGRNYNQPRSGSGRLPEWAIDDTSDAGFYDAPAATSAFIASGNYPGGGGGGSGGGYGGGSKGGRGGGRGGRSNRYGNGGFDSGSGFGGRGLGGEFEYTEGDSNFGAGQDRF